MKLPPLRRSIGDSLAFIAGATMVRVAMSGQHRLFVKASMGQWLLASGVLLAAASGYRILALAGTGQSRDDQVLPEVGHGAEGHHPGLHDHPVQMGQAGREDHAGDPGDDGHGHVHGASWAALLMLLPITALFAIKPGSLGSFAAGRSASVVSAEVDTTYSPLKIDETGVAEIPLNDVWLRASYDKTKSLEKQPLRMVGFVVPDKQSSATTPTFLLTRFKIACCAADGIPIQIRIDSTTAAIPPTESWVEVTGTFVGMKDKIPFVRLTGVRPINEPQDPYE